MKVVVYGWLNHGNLGDQLFIPAYKKLFPQIDFTFTDHITKAKAIGADAIFFGGGSFLLGDPNISPEVLAIVKTKPIFYIGIGVELDIHPIHQELMSVAKLIATRSADQLDRVKAINPSAMFLPDLIYSLQSDIKQSKRDPKSILVMPNILVVPQVSDPHWMHSSWGYFKSEFVQFLDYLVDNGFAPTFFSMCRNQKTNDHWAGTELMSHMSSRSSKMLSHDTPLDIGFLSSIVSKYQVVITQRFHGIVLSEMTRTPYIAIHHHDKLKFASPMNGESLSYYGINKRLLIETFECCLTATLPELPISLNEFDLFAKKVVDLLEEPCDLSGLTKMTTSA